MCAFSVHHIQEELVPRSPAYVFLVHKFGKGHQYEDGPDCKNCHQLLEISHGQFDYYCNHKEVQGHTSHRRKPNPDAPHIRIEQFHNAVDQPYTYGDEQVQSNDIRTPCPVHCRTGYGGKVEAYHSIHQQSHRHTHQIVFENRDAEICNENEGQRQEAVVKGPNHSKPQKRSNAEDGGKRQHSG